MVETFARSRHLFTRLHVSVTLAYLIHIYYTIIGRDQPLLASFAAFYRICHHFLRKQKNKSESQDTIFLCDEILSSLVCIMFVCKVYSVSENQYNLLLLCI